MSASEKRELLDISITWRKSRYNIFSGLIPSIFEEIVAHLEELPMSFDRYFDVENMETFKEWDMDPYSFNLEIMSRMMESWKTVVLCSWQGLWEKFYKRVQWSMHISPASRA